MFNSENFDKDINKEIGKILAQNNEKKEKYDAKIEKLYEEYKNWILVDRKKYIISTIKKAIIDFCLQEEKTKTSILLFDFFDIYGNSCFFDDAFLVKDWFIVHLWCDIFRLRPKKLELFKIHSADERCQFLVDQLNESKSSFELQQNVPENDSLHFDYVINFENKNRACWMNIQKF